ncbi:limonene-1,2-epoxide hydrolase family protein [Mycolicibacterium sp. XJ1819]
MQESRRSTPAQGSAVTEIDALARAYFAARAHDPGHFKRELVRLVTDDFVWSAPGYRAIHGMSSMLSFVDEQVKQCYKRSEINILRLAVGTGFVLTERIDTMFDDSGSVISSIAIMGRLDIRAGKISAHRDYFDPTVIHTRSVAGTENGIVNMSDSSM